MREGFERFKKRHYVEALVKSLLYGVAFGASVLSVLLAVLKLTGSYLEFWGFLLIGIGAGAIATGVVFLMLKPNDKKIAKRIDTSFQWNENVQTMVEFTGETGEIVSLQREDALERLSSAPVRAFKFEKMWKSFAAIGVAVCLLITALVIPAKETEAETPPAADEAFELTDWHIMRMNDLIAYVEASDAVETERNLVSSGLEVLLAELREIQTEKKMQTTVVASMTYVDGVADSLNTYWKLGGTLQLSDVASVKALGEAVNDTNGERLTQNMDAFRETLKNTQADAEELSVAVQAFSEKAELAVKGAKVSEADELYKALIAFVEEMDTVAQVAASEGYTVGWAAVGEAIHTVSADILPLLEQQEINETLGEYVISELTVIFQIPKEMIPDFTNSVGGGESGGSSQTNRPEEIGPDGGLSDAVKEYASDDDIYDPESNGHVQYGEVYDEYYQDIMDKLLDEEVSDDVKKIINKYFTYLSSNRNNAE